MYEQVDEVKNGRLGSLQNPLARILRIEFGNLLRDQLPDFLEEDGTAFANVFDPTVNSGQSFGVHRYFFGLWNVPP